MEADPGVIEFLNAALCATPFLYSADVRAGIVARARLSMEQGRDFTEETRQLAAAMLPFRAFIHDDAFARLTNCEVISIAEPICNAIATRRDGQGVIAIFDGLLDASVANLALSYAVQQLPGEFDKSAPRADYPDVSARNWVALILFTILRRYLTHAEPLPDFRLLIPSPDRSDELRQGVMGTAWWVLLHELGHIALEHTRADFRDMRPSIGRDLLVDEHLSRFQEQELEADAFAYECLSETGRQFYYGWMNNALGPAIILETMVAGGSSSHPLSINRIARALALAETENIVGAELRSREHLAKHGDAHVRIRREHQRKRAEGAPVALEGWTRDDCLTALEGLNSLFEGAGIDLARFRRSLGFGWREAFATEP